MDVGYSMSNSEPGQEPAFEQAKKVIQKFVQRQVCCVLWCLSLFIDFICWM